MRIFRTIIASVLIMLALSAYNWVPAPVPEVSCSDISESSPTPEPINRVDLIRASFPDDWKPQYVYSEPGHIAYPEVIERNFKAEKRAEQNAFERFMAEREMHR